MVSVNNIGLNSAVLASLRQTNADLATSQNRIASGLKVASARDNAGVWATATSIRKDIAAQDGMGANIAISKGQADAAYAALTTIADIITKMQTTAGKLVAGANANNVEVQKDISSYQKQMLAAVANAGFQGVNLLAATDASTITTAIGQDNGTPVNMTFSTTQILNVGNTSGTLVGSAYASVSKNTAFDGTSTNDTQAHIDDFTGALSSGLAAVNTYAARVAAYSDSLSKQQDFITKINDIRTTALSSLVDANMEEESAKVQSLQVKQQLAYQALSIGNGAAQNILRLFQ
ncbi:hypothetical protein NS226_14015 [Aureimonas ureilytica]|uniref:Flagellin n=1 Tax=Aureimonas ureilytica TaxID=401562 RepID=A0A175R6X5_9HYPH|nr:flagellin [Aureimonas ureilytica]KTQ94200.1 hypothetical protein NS226_14015 [Aureimonas ureilytica]